MQNNYESQSTLGKSKVSSDFKIYSEREAMTGQFMAVMFSNSETYLIGYLNQLIHGVTSALKDFEEIIKVEKFQIDEKFNMMITAVCEDSLDISELVELAYSKDLEVDQDKIDDFVPELITFKVGDLLRCKCASH